MAADGDVDALELRLDDACIAALATAPLPPADMRFLVAAMKSATVLERIGDDAAGIARGAMASHAPNPRLAGLARHARGMLGDAIEALVRSDNSLALRVLLDARTTRERAEALARGVVQQPLADPAKLGEAFHDSAILQRLERIAGHAASFARMVLYATDTAAEPEGTAA